LETPCSQHTGHRDISLTMTLKVTAPSDRTRDSGAVADDTSDRRDELVRQLDALTARLSES
jgi:hypothetical protein